ncbi:hypothetical protein EJB05_29957, partial [Eragrostis curvula]
MLEETEAKVIPVLLFHHLWTDQQKLLNRPIGAKNLQLLPVDCAVALATYSLFVLCSDRERGRVSKAARWLLLGFHRIFQQVQGGDRKRHEAIELSAASSVSDHQRRQAKREESSESSAVPVSPEEASSPPLTSPEKIVIGSSSWMTGFMACELQYMISDGGETSGAADATPRMLHISC